MDPITLLRHAAVKVLQTMAQVHIKTAPPGIKPLRWQGNVTGAVLPFEGDMKGAMSIWFTDDMLNMVVTNLFGEGMKNDEGARKDTAGEFLNMISGEFRRLLGGQGKTVQGGIPITTTQWPEAAEGQKAVVPFKTEAGAMIMEIEIGGTSAEELLASFAEGREVQAGKSESDKLVDKMFQ